ncbi:MAG: hydroxymethylglutaryl-CoA synthase, partial [Thermoprotei archaeon]
MSHVNVGIDDVAASVPELYVDMEEFSARRGLQSEHIKKGIGMVQMAVADIHEDAATLAANAALELLRKNDVKPSQIGRIYVGTETMEDKSKPIASKVVGMLENVYGADTFSHVDGVDHVFACIGATYALENTLDWLRSGRANGKYGVVIATDIAEYDLGSDGEYTQGAGAVAMLVGANPRLIEMEPAVGTCTKHERDFYKPLDRDTPVVDGKYSIAVYLDAMKTAYLNFVPEFVKLASIQLKPGEAPSDYADYLAFHLPFPEMATQAAAYFFMHEWRSLPRWKEVEKDTGPLPPRTRYTVQELLSEEYRQFRKKFTSSTLFKKTYESKVYPSTMAGRRIGNSYSASLYFGLLSILEVEASKDLRGKRIGFASYGSGCSAKIFSGIVGERYKEVAQRIGLFSKLDARRRIGFDEYVKLHEAKPGCGKSLVDPSDEFGI